MPASHPWPLYCFPTAHVAGRFPFSQKLATHVYHHRTMAIHQHFYHAKMQIGRRKFEIQPGDLTLSPSNTDSRYAVEEDDGFHWCIHFDAVPPASPSTSIPLHLRPGPRLEYLTDRIRAIVDIGKRRSIGSKSQREHACAEVSAMLQSLLLKLPWLASGESKRAYNRKSASALEAVQHRLDAHFTQPISVEELARESGLSRNYFASQFHEIYGVTVQKYLLDRRIDLARKLLISSSLPIKEVAYECGIADPHYFNKQFRRSTGLSPSEYRERGGQVW